MLSISSESISVVSIFLRIYPFHLRYLMCKLIIVSLLSFYFSTFGSDIFSLIPYFNNLILSFFFFVSLAKCYVFSESAFGFIEFFLIFSLVIFLISILFIYILIFTILFLWCALDIICSNFPSFLRWKLEYWCFIILT